MHRQVPQPPQRPPARLRPHLRTTPTLPCLVCGRPVRAEFQPVFCHDHRNNVTPITGWAFFDYRDVEIINISWRFNWTEPLLAEMRRLAQLAEMAELGAGIVELAVADQVLVPQPFQARPYQQQPDEGMESSDDEDL
jgi:hypothetical protein